MSARPRIPQTPRLRTANGVFFTPSARMCSARPSIRRSHTRRVASGVTSRAPMPVPPVVTINRTSSARRMIMSSILVESSGTTSRTTTENFNFSSSWATAGPDWSSRSPCEQESLTVTTAAVREESAIEQNVFLLLAAFPGRRSGSSRGRGNRGGGGRLRLGAAFALRFVEQAQAFHQETLGVELGSFLAGFAFEVELKIPSRPAQDFEDGFVADQRSVGGMFDLAFDEEHFAFFAFVAERKPAALASHFERLHEVDDVHLREIAAHDAVGRSGLGHLLERDAVDHALHPPRGILEEEGL